MRGRRRGECDQWLRGRRIRWSATESAQSVVTTGLIRLSSTSPPQRLRGSQMSDYSVSFRSVLRGYDQAQVDQHMNELAQAAASAWQEATEHTRQINDLTAANSQLKSEAESHAQRARVLEEAQIEAAAPTYTGLGERIGSVLTLVDSEIFELRTRAQADAANCRALAEENALAIRQAAQEYAREIRSGAEDEVARIVEDARQQAEDLMEDARQQAESTVSYTHLTLPTKR